MPAPKRTQRVKALRLIAAGHSDREIARRLRVSPSSVGNWRRAAGFPQARPASAMTQTPPVTWAPEPSRRSERPRPGTPPVRTPLLPRGSIAGVAAELVGTALRHRRNRPHVRSSASAPAQAVSLRGLPGEIFVGRLPQPTAFADRRTSFVFDEHGRPRVVRRS
jgi:hypothetical protein